MKTLNCAVILALGMGLAALPAAGQLLNRKSFAVQVTPAEGGQPPLPICTMTFRGSVIGLVNTDCPMGDGLYVEIPLSTTASLFVVATQDVYFSFDGIWNSFFAIVWQGQDEQAFFGGFGTVATFCGFGCFREPVTISGIVSSPP